MPGIPLSQGENIIGFIPLFLFPALRGDYLPLQTVHPEALPVIVDFYNHLVRIEEGDDGSC
jgi:hypothetical protein